MRQNGSMWTFWQNGPMWSIMFQTVAKISCQNLKGSCSAISKPIFASNYSLCNTFQDLKDLRNPSLGFSRLFSISDSNSCTVLQSGLVDSSIGMQELCRRSSTTASSGQRSSRRGCQLVNAADAEHVPELELPFVARVHKLSVGRLLLSCASRSLW